MGSGSDRYFLRKLPVNNYRWNENLEPNMFHLVAVELCGISMSNISRCYCLFLCVYGCYVYLIAALNCYVVCFYVPAGYTQHVQPVAGT